MIGDPALLFTTIASSVSIGFLSKLIDAPAASLAIASSLNTLVTSAVQGPAPAGAPVTS